MMEPDGQSNFIESLNFLQAKYPEYKNILRLLIEQVQRGKIAKVQAKLQQLQNDDW
jgi:hypothetical protein